jgi:hypothetical protein
MDGDRLSEKVIVRLIVPEIKQIIWLALES